MKMYGLCFKGRTELLTFSTSSNDGDFCVDVKHTLETPDSVNAPWLIASRKEAEDAAEHDTQGYNALYTTPCNPYAGQLEVVEVTLSIG